ncbi:uncharacterized protein LOC128229360 [Mya arenaria]|uniref:uncharacterized protein LOC128229360 n=1 Tax=Mya arenaria TaxID=6604 RepID=UPI0022E35947|nr:uncharacterized protein LOC128229360 [Mya arenaria]XP_052797203.1 uncharacterized protein LOC128229360 [Mya arenaria]
MSNARKKCYTLPARIPLQRSAPRQHTFITDREQIHFVLGESSSSWFEDATSQRLKQEGHTVLESHDASVLDSPMATPRISQLLASELAVGQSPVMHSSPYSQPTFHTPDMHWSPDVRKCWEKPELNLSPSPITQRLLAQSCRTPNGVSSLRLDDSALIWSNSLATPPRDTVHGSSSLLEEEMSKGKDPARMLFSPRERLNSTMDSITPLDSTAEEEPSDLSTSQTFTNLDSFKGPSQIPETEKTMVSNPCPNMEIHSMSNLDEKKSSQNGSHCNGHKVDNVTQNEESLGNMNTDRWKENFKKRLLERKNSNKDLSRRKISKNGSFVSQCLSQERQESTPIKIVSNDSSEDVSLSPTFSQKGVKVKSKQTKVQTNAVDDVLSDFFENLAEEQEKRPAPSRKRKSLELEAGQTKGDISIDEEGEAGVVAKRLSDLDLHSTPKGSSLKSILMSEQKRKSSGKKVRFSEEVREHFTFSESKSVLKGKSDSDMQKKRLIKKVKFNNEVKKQKSELSDSRVPKSYKICDSFDSNDLQGDTINNSSKESLKREVENISIKTKLKSCIDKVQTESERTKSRKVIDATDKASASEILVHARSSHSQRDKLLDNIKEGSRKNSESGITETSLNIDSNKLSSVVKVNVKDDPIKQSEITCKSRVFKKFLYPSVSKNIQPSKRFQYNERTSMEGKISVLKPVYIQDIVSPASIVSEHTNEGTVKNNLGNQITLNNQSVCTEKDEESEANFKETRSSADSFPQKSTSICVTVGSVGFRSASGKKMVLSQEALHKAEQLLIEESGAKVNKKDESVAEVSKKGAGNDSVPHTMQNDQAEEDLEFSEWPEDFCEENEGFLLDEVVETAPESGDNASVNTKDKVVIEFTETNNKYAKQGMKKQSPSEYDKGYAASKSISRNRKEQLDGSQGEIVQISKDKIECENRNENDQLNMHSLGLISGSGKTLDIENETLQKANGLMIVSNLIEMRKKQPSSLVEEFKEQLALPVSGSSAISTRKDVNKSVQMVKYGGKGSKNTSMTVFPEADYSDSLEQDLMNQIQTLKTPSLDSTDFPFKDTTQNKMLSKPSKFPPGAVVPQGFRPFKPPKIMKTLSPKKEKKVLYPESKKIENVNRNKDMTSRQKDITTSDYNINTQDIGNMFDDEMTLTQCTADFENNNAGVTSKIIETSVGTASTVKSVFHDPTDDLTDKRTVHQHLDVKMKDIYSMTCSGDARWTGMKEMNTEIVYDVLETITCDSVTSVGKVKITSEKKHFSNDLKVGVFQGFSKASGSKINISEKAMKHARGILESDGNEDPFVPEVPNFQGFSSSSGIKHSISDNALKDVGGMLEPNDNKKQTVPEVSQFQGFSTASGSKENIPKKDLTHYRGVLETDVNEQCLVPEVPKFQGFSTASGSTVNISEKALKQARGMLESDDNEYPLVPEVPNCQGFSTSSGSKENISKRALKHDRGMLDPDYREKEKVSQFQGFSTVSESKVNVSNKSLKSARAVLESNNNKQLVEPDDPKFEGCSTESESKLNISVKALKHAHVMLESDNNEQTLVPEVPNFQWFSTSSRSKVNFPEKALKHAREMLESNNKDQHIVPEVSQFEGFSTVAESKVNISVMSLGHAREMLETGDDEPPLVPDVSKLQGFTKTLGSKECISENALKHLRGKFSDDTGQPLVPEVPQFQGFSTASGSKVNISEKALKHARGALESEDNEQFVEPEVPKFQGFSTASGRKVNISEKALNHASGVLASEGNKHFVEPKSTQFQGFSTASGIKVSISENALKHAKGILESGDFEQPLVPEVPKFQGFSTALGSKVNISEKALKHAKGVLESDDHEQPFVPEIPKFQGFSTALGSKVNISKKALKHVKGVLESDDNEQPFVPDLPKFQGFSTASGSKVNISEKALKHAKGVLESDDHEQPFVPEIPKFQGFSTASGSKVNISEKALKHAKGVLESDDHEQPFVPEIPKFQGSSTASGSRVNISEKALKHAKGVIECDNHEQPFIPGILKFQGFSTASGSKMNISEKTLKHAKGDLESDNHEQPFVPEIPNFQGFSTASGSKVNISEKALKHAKGVLESDDHEQPFVLEIPKFQGSSTASESKVNISVKALKHAKGVLESDDNEQPFVPDLPKFQGFSTASGSKVSISEKALKHAKEVLESDDNEKPFVPDLPKFQGFSTASGSKVSISEKALKHAKEVLESDDNEQPFVPDLPKFQGFSTASGSKMNISEKALKHAKGVLESDDHEKPFVPDLPQFQGFSTASGSKVSISEKALKHAKGVLESDDHEKPFVPDLPQFQGFSTASGSKVSISEKALKHAKGVLESDDNEQLFVPDPPKFQGFSTASGSKVNISEKALKHAKGVHESDDNEQPFIPDLPKFQGFSTASGSKVSISEKALKHAKGVLESDDNEQPFVQDFPKFQGFSTASGSRVNISEKALKHAKGVLESDDNEQPFILDLPKFQGFSTASGSKVNISEKALKHIKGVLESDDNEQPFVPDLPKFQGFSTASGSKVSISEKALKHAKGVLESDDNEQPFLPDLPKFQGFSTSSGSKVFISETAFEQTKENIPSETSLDDGAEMKRYREHTNAYRGAVIDNGLVCKQDNKNRKRLLSVDDQETEFKRQKMDVETDLLGRGAHRKPLRSRPEGTTTDKRHPGFRPFKPVISKFQCKMTSQNISDIDQNATHQGPNTSGSVKPTFQTPYKTTPGPLSTDQPAKPNSSKSITPVFRPKQNIQFVQGNKTPSAEQGGMFKTEHSACSDIKSKPILGNTHKNMLDVKREIHEEKQDDKELEIGSSNIQTSFVVPEETSRNMESNVKETKDFDEGDGIGMKKVVAKDTVCDVKEIVDVAMETGDDEFSQGEDDIFYCDLLEARRHQDMLIKKREMDKVHPRVGRLFEMKKSSIRYQLSDLHDRLANYERPNFGVVSSTAADYKFNLADHYGQGTSHVLVGDGAYLVPDDAGLIGKQEFYRGFLTVESVDRKLISEAWVYNHYRWIVWKLAAYTLTFSSIAQRCFTPEMVMLQLKYRYDREIDRAERSSIKKIYEQDDTPGKRMVLCVAEIRSSVGEEGKQVQLYLSDGWYGIPAQVDSALTRLVLAGRIFVGQKLIMARAELVGGEDASTPLEAASSVMLKLGCNCVREARWDSRLGYQGNPQPLCVPLSTLQPDGGPLGVTDVVLVRKYPTMYMEKLSGGGCLFRSGSAEERARREFESRKQTEMEKLYSRLQEEMEIEDRQEKKGRGVRKFGDREVAALQTGEEIHDAIQSAAQPDTVQSYLSERQLELLYDHQRCLQDQKRADLAARVHAAWDVKEQAFQERQVTPMIKFRLAGCARKDMDSKTSVMLTVWRPSPEISELQEGHRYRIYNLNVGPTRGRSRGSSIQLTATKQTRFRKMVIDENFLDNVFEPREVLTVSDITERQAAYGEVDFVGLVIRMNHASMEGERGEDVMYLADWQGRLLALHFPAGIQAGGYELPREGEVWCCSSLQSRGRLLPSSLPTLTVSQEVTTLSTRPQGGLHRRAVDKLAQATKDKTIFLEKAKADLGDFLKDSNKCYTSSKAINPIKSIEEQLREDFGETSWQIMFEGDSSFSDIGEPQGDDGKGILPTTRQVYQTDIASNEECDNVAQVSQRCSSGSEEYTPVNNQFCSTDGDDIKQKISLETAMEVASTSEQTLGFPDSTEEFQKVTKQAPDCESLETPVKTSVNKSTSVSNQNVKNQTPIDPSQVVQASKLVHPPVPLTPTSTPHPPTPSPAQRPVVRAKIARLLSYGSPAALSPLNSVVPRSVIKTFKPPAFKKI